MLRSKVELPPHADMMSDMKTFTVRDLDRTPAKVLAACDAEGEVRIQTRDGRAYVIKPDGPPRMSKNLPDFRARRKALFPEPLPASFARELDRFIAGE